MLYNDQVDETGGLVCAGARTQRLGDAEPVTAYQKLVAAGDIGHPRLFVGTSHKSASVALKD